MDLKDAAKQGFSDYLWFNGGNLSGLALITPRVTVDPRTLGARTWRDAYEIGAGMARTYIEAVTK